MFNIQNFKFGTLKSKFQSFNWNVDQVDGHNVKQIIKSLNKLNKNKKPNLIIANTIKGKGKIYGNKFESHYEVLDTSKYNLSKKI